MKKNRAVSFKYLGYDIIRFSAIPGLLWFRPKKYFISEDAKQRIKGGALIISNHITLFDPMYLMLTIKTRRHHCICMDELFRDNKFKRWLFTKCFLCLPITRTKATFGQIKDIISSLKNGDLVTMFPEGKINETSEDIQGFKNGMIMLAMRGNVPIIPLYIKRRKHFYSRLEVAFGDPIDVNGFKADAVATPEEVANACKYIEEKEYELKEFMLKGKEK